jgi:hypothetical protein
MTRPFPLLRVGLRVTRSHGIRLPRLVAAEVRRALLLAVLAIGCGGGATPSLSSAPIGFALDTTGNPCGVADHVVGQLAVDATDAVVLRDDRGGVTQLIWSMARGYHPRWVGREVEILDGNGAVVAVTGHRYELGGQYWSGQPGPFWVCVDPQTQTSAG